MGENKHKENEHKSGRRKTLRSLSQVSQLGATAIVCVAFGLFLGYWLDSFFNTSPIFLIVFSLLGVISAIKAMIDLAKKL